jgi:hypothetical protein
MGSKRTTSRVDARRLGVPAELDDEAAVSRRIASGELRSMAGGETPARASVVAALRARIARSRQRTA